jgi:hypothetical protein
VAFLFQVGVIKQMTKTQQNQGFQPVLTCLGTKLESLSWLRDRLCEQR